jgi:hypothetical protein
VLKRVHRHHERDGADAVERYGHLDSQSLD